MDQRCDDNDDRRPDAGGSALWLHPDDDLAPNRPGEALLPLPVGTGGPSRLLRRLRPQHDRLAAERATGAALDALAPLGWYTLHSVPLPGHAVLAHLTAGPGGVFAVRAAHTGGAPAQVDDDALRLARGRRVSSEPEVRLARRGAGRAAHALTVGCGFPVAVRPVLVVVGAPRVRRSAGGTAGVWVLREPELPALGARGGVLRPDLVEAIHAVARDRRVWSVA
ncbi:NERD domain-containing protein [Streptomyces otsuchiensis]|uniref:NERD domain-containing protein n=1 Tax=Streptomyces otsuchiensis TaxID=2681388 RepID=UPI00103218DB|nr:NERD domain-containing protein [Streptomyces otsuchiensis]